MSQVFEDEFMEWHASLISLCKELTKGAVDKIYVYCCMESDEKMFDAFFLKGGKAVHAGDMKIPSDIQGKFLSLGMEDMAHIEQVCIKHGRPVPTEIKMVYDVGTRSLETHYCYEEYLDKEDKCAEDIYDEWMKEINAKYSQKQVAESSAKEQVSTPVEEPKKKSGFRFPFFGKGKK